ncbi:MBL fold metallo-hydrolase [Kutzneria kofuensis]|uniref:L-ascorbate metabolism protein UlaG (Beta-lactamase superfamily) n=1 Tax=Kutzneria kofuensis TaxID=103725 RepID=A0A7W9KPP3_9PSEU|nr:MBL fold metallo-hydrolase [Kutzneria kofuensis]MBB5896426.1 L-ascorbate metabolism protein UlaG (beta-lactamase superfamily) [Kutzneria kofuensis]
MTLIGAGALGGRPSGDRLTQIRQSPNYRDGAFQNPAGPAQPVPSGHHPAARPDRRRPAGPVPLVRPELTAPATGVRTTWLGHSTALVELEGGTVLFDPVWSDRVSPVALVGPKRLHPVPVDLAELPPVDAVVISHDHYDHLDTATIKAIAARWPKTRFVTPLGVGAHLQRWRIPASRIDEVDWTESVTVAGLTLTATAARHFSGRVRPGSNGTLWAGWVVAGTAHRVFYTGDSGYFDGYREIGRRHGPFDVTLIQIGAYSHLWPDVHMTPEEAVAAHRDLRGELLIPVHWGTFALAGHSWSEPIERLLAAADGLRVAVPRPGQSVTDVPTTDSWWREIA